MIIGKNPILNNHRFSHVRTKTISNSGIEHNVPMRAQHVKKEDQVFYWFSYQPAWVRESNRYQWKKRGVEGIEWGRCR